jgi:predicted GH43/DUF377 family glycosyl hydrolase
MSDARTAAPRYVLVRIDELSFDASPEVAAMYKLSPFVWREGDALGMLLRVVNRRADASQKRARIHHGRSQDGLHFVLGDVPVIAPGPLDDPDSYDSGGCEDPTLARAGDTSYVYYTGWNELRKRGELLLATGPDLEHLTKRGIALASSERALNPKEAEIVRARDGSWRLFFEFAHEGRSKIGIARSAGVGGPWTVLEPCFDRRPESFDSWHLSTGPIFDGDPNRPVMFYNGASQRAEWRIGWIVFDADYTRVIARCAEPLVLPHLRRNDDDTDIAFAASAVAAGGDIHLYYSVADQYCMRAVVRPITSGS